jgi:Holliday junction resolvase RusA-like endonuclease
MGVLEIVVPWKPARANELYGRAKDGHIYKKDKARWFQEAIVAYALRAKRKARWLMLRGPVDVAITLYLGSARQDADSPVKTILDALQNPRPGRPGAGIYLDDLQVCDYLVSRKVDPENPRTLIVVGQHGWVGLRGPETAPVTQCSNSAPTPRTKADRAALAEVRKKSADFERRARLVSSRRDYTGSSAWEDGHRETPTPINPGEI